jgi:large subunit ribosomal protein L17
MRHLKAGRKLNRNASHRRSLFRNLALALFRHERIITTVAKAKEARRFIEKIITLAKKGLANGGEKKLHYYRLVLSRMGTAAKAEINPEGSADKGDHKYIITKLFTEIAPRYADRPGGYTRVLKRHERRLGDAGPTAFLELVKAGEQRRERRKQAPAPAPVIAPVPAPAPAPVPAPAAAPEQQEPPASS